MTVFILLGEYDTHKSIICVKESQEECVAALEGIDKYQDGWDGFVIQEWAEFGMRNEIEV